MRRVVQADCKGDRSLAPADQPAEPHTSATSPSSTMRSSSPRAKVHTLGSVNANETMSR
jgi:hypothetical protein